MSTIDRRTFIKGAALAGAATLTLNQRLWAADDFDPIRKEIAKRHDEALKRLQDWIKQISIAAENRGYPEGAEFMIEARAGRRVSTGDPGRERWKAGGFRDAGCRREEDRRSLFHVRREAGGPGGMGVAALGSEAHR